MTVEEVRRHLEAEDRNYDNFPVGMRVLAVDDDPICLKLLEGLLRKCQYQGQPMNDNIVHQNINAQILGCKGLVVSPKLFAEEFLSTDDRDLKQG